MAAADPPLEEPSRWGGKARDFVEVLGDWGLFTFQTLGWCLTRRPNPGTLAHSVYFVGVKTAPVVVITGLFIGMVLAIQAYEAFRMFGMSSRQGDLINASMIRELGPVLVATMLAGRVGSAMAAELATMRITEQVDALHCLGAHPLHHLVMPRLYACVLIIPLLTILANLAGVLGGAYISVSVFGIDSHHYWSHSRGSVTAWEVVTGLIKPVFFGAVIALVCCHRGLTSRPGAEGVGQAATEAFVASFVAILVVNFFLSLFFTQLGGVLGMSKVPRVMPSP
jgi:phospholipid/cholesterol/gamma-HCH transport system permease protein